MINKLKLLIKRLVGKVVYTYTYLKNNISTKYKKIKKNKSFLDLILSILKQWKTSSLTILSIIFIYYGLGAFISSNINNTLNHNINIDKKNSRYATHYLIHTLKSQIDDAPWTPSLPLIFPASILDNLPNFQLGSKDAARYFVKKMSAIYLDPSLKNSGQLLDYPANIWLFSQDKNDKLSPGSAKQYRKAIADLTEFSKKENIHYQPSLTHLLSQLKGINNLLAKQNTKIDKHALEHKSDLFDIKADDLFYYTQGVLYTTHYYLLGLSKDYQDLIVENELYDETTTTLKIIQKAIELNPTIIKNAPLDNTYSANHLIYLAYYIANAQNHINHIYTTIKNKAPKELNL